MLEKDTCTMDYMSILLRQLHKLTNRTPTEGQGTVEQGRAGQGRAGQGRAGQDRTGQGRAGTYIINNSHA